VEWTPDYPRKPGHYLFVGCHAANRVDAREIELYKPGRRPYLVRVGVSATGALMYIGPDVFDPEDSVGLWLEVDPLADPVYDRVAEMVLDRAAENTVAKHAADGPMYRDTLEYKVTGLDPDKRLAGVVDALIDRALARGLLEVDPDNPSKVRRPEGAGRSSG
jgi:hypothetical protein